MKIAILGAGNLGGAIARGLAKGSIFKEDEIIVTARSQQTLDALKEANPKFYATNDNTEAVKGADVIVLAVKPWLLSSVISQIRHSVDFEKQIIISVVAGVSFDDLQTMISYEYPVTPIMFRVIPNTAVAIRQSMTLISSRNATREQEEKIKSFFDELGKAVIIEERMMDAGSALCSCGIAFAMRYMKANIDGAVEMGFYAQEAREMIAQTLKGAAEILLQDGSMPDEEIYKVSTPGGMTIKGLNEMDAKGFSAAMISGLKATLRKG